MFDSGEEASAPFSVSVDETDPDHPVVTVVGDLDLQTVGPLRAELDRLAGPAPRRLTIDVAGVRFVDSTGLATIVHAWRDCRDAGTVLRLRSVPRQLASILDVTGVAELLTRPADGDAHDPGARTA